MEEIEEILGAYKQYPAQRTEEWFAQRMNTIGSSEIYSFSRNQQRVLNKKNSKPFNSTNSICSFGSIFEHQAKKIISSERNIEIHEIGSIPYPDSSINLAASPDGICILEDNTFELIEIKCPPIRTIGNDIPLKYKYQMEAQLMCIPKASYVSFYDFEFRIKAERDFDTNNYNRYFHHKPGRAFPTPETIMRKGIVEVQDFKGIDHGKGVFIPPCYNTVFLLHEIDPDCVVYHDDIHAPLEKDSSFIGWQLHSYKHIKYRSDPKIRKNILESFNV